MAVHAWSVALYEPGHKHQLCRAVLARYVQSVTSAKAASLLRNKNRKINKYNKTSKNENKKK